MFVLIDICRFDSMYVLLVFFNVFEGRYFICFIIFLYLCSYVNKLELVLFIMFILLFIERCFVGGINL